MNVLRKQIEWIITGQATNGYCPTCNTNTVTITEDKITCSNCQASIKRPDAPSWI